jgi:hypothetical protein
MVAKVATQTLLGTCVKQYGPRIDLDMFCAGVGCILVQYIYRCWWWSCCIVSCFGQRAIGAFNVAESLFISIHIAITT